MTTILRTGHAIVGGITLGVILAISISGCAYPVRNFDLQKISPDEGYRWNNLPPDDMPDTLVVVSASGGGTRAATLELGTLRALDKTVLPSGKRLSEEVDMISSVSGGSVTASYFALHGRDALQTGWPNPPLPYDLESKFIRRNGTKALIFDVVNPIEWARLSTPSRERIDVLIDYFDRTLFTEGETYDTLLKARRRPFLVLNAADMVEGIPFPFTQNTFDLLCSDLSRTKLSVGVAASAAFPLALSPVTLKNYSRCAAQDAPTDWPPAWVQSEARTDWQSTDRQDIVGRGRVEAAYAFGVPRTPQDSVSKMVLADPRTAPLIDGIGAEPVKKAYIHLLDGGIADNLGVSEPYRVLTQQGMPAPFFNLIMNGTIKRILFVMINARSAASSDLDKKPDTPGIIDMLEGTTGASIDNASLGAAQRLRDLLLHKFQDKITELQAQHNPNAANFQTVKDNTFLVSVDFDAIPDATCRQRFHNIGTNWGMKDEEVTAVLDVGEALTASDPQFKKAATALQATIDPGLPSVEQACTEVPHNENK